MTDTTDIMLGALLEIKRRAVDHPAFDQEAFEKRDWNSLVKQGGDICDWTTVAIWADDAIKKATEKVI